MHRGFLILSSLVATVVISAGCEPEDLSLPTAEDVTTAYQYSGDLTAEMSGNVAVVTISQPYAQLRRGGTIWAKVGPYIVLFSQPTLDLFQTYGGLAAIRVVTVTGSGQAVATATLLRDGLNELTWRRALNIAGRARRDGTERVTVLEELINWGEEHTEFEYDPRYIRRR
ncbi:MAG: hypothetical protein HKN73_15885 [Gemmatimonadetes bacterium]|nr:hypothetical protein [Gemmatimonadota bacterium]